MVSHATEARSYTPFGSRIAAVVGIVGCGQVGDVTPGLRTAVEDVMREIGEAYERYMPPGLRTGCIPAVGVHSNTCDLVGFRQGYTAPAKCSCGADASADVPLPAAPRNDDDIPIGPNGACPICYAEPCICGERNVALPAAPDPLIEIAKYLSPGNENVKRGDLIASIRDLAQAFIAEQDNARQLERLVDLAAAPDLRGLSATWREQLDAYDKGSNKLSSDEAGQLSQCADDLDAALQADARPLLQDDDTPCPRCARLILAAEVDARRHRTGAEVNRPDEADARPRIRKCAATLSADPPMDCDWPFCGCDPAADKVLEALQESGMLKERGSPAERGADARPPWQPEALVEDEHRG